MSELQREVLANAIEEVANLSDTRLYGAFVGAHSDAAARARDAVRDAIAAARGAMAALRELREHEMTRSLPPNHMGNDMPDHEPTDDGGKLGPRS